MCHLERLIYCTWEGECFLYRGLFCIKLLMCAFGEECDRIATRGELEVWPILGKHKSLLGRLRTLFDWCSYLYERI